MRASIASFLLLMLAAPVLGQSLGELQREFGSFVDQHGAGSFKVSEDMVVFMGVLRVGDENDTGNAPLDELPLAPRAARVRELSQRVLPILRRVLRMHTGEEFTETLVEPVGREAKIQYQRTVNNVAVEGATIDLYYNERGALTWILAPQVTVSDTMVARAREPRASRDEVEKFLREKAAVVFESAPARIALESGNDIALYYLVLAPKEDEPIWVVFLLRNYLRISARPPLTIRTAVTGGGWP